MSNKAQTNITLKELSDRIPENCVCVVTHTSKDNCSSPYVWSMRFSGCKVYYQPPVEIHFVDDENTLSLYNITSISVLNDDMISSEYKILCIDVIGCVESTVILKIIKKELTNANLLVIL